MSLDMSARFHFAGRTYEVRVADEENPSPLPVIAVTCIQEATDGPGWLESVRWPNDDEVSGFFGLTARFWEAGAGANEALYAVGRRGAK